MRLTVDRVVNDPNNVAITIDGYVPVDIKLLDPQGLPPLYWRVGDGKKSLLEWAVLPETGFLSSITLVIMNPSFVHKVDSLPVNLTGSKYGLPVVNLGLWEGSENDDFSHRFVDDFNVNIQAFISSKSILLLIDGSKEKTNWIRCGDDIYLGTDDGRNITNLFLDNLTQEEIESFFEAVS
ncbi:hypothetical protein [Yersinia enterocolitica]|uniref:hypothetical protein n=1 Tax=Yersinia enterocolitica TaxID=630 RepID=UPI0037D709E1